MQINEILKINEKIRNKMVCWMLSAFSHGLFTCTWTANPVEGCLQILAVLCWHASTTTQIGEELLFVHPPDKTCLSTSTSKMIEQWNDVYKSVLCLRSFTSVVQSVTKCCQQVQFQSSWRPCNKYKSRRHRGCVPWIRKR
jgi:hypothetical protein